MHCNLKGLLALIGWASRNKQLGNNHHNSHNINSQTWALPNLNQNRIGHYEHTIQVDFAWFFLLHLIKHWPVGYRRKWSPRSTGPILSSSFTRFLGHNFFKFLSEFRIFCGFSLLFRTSHTSVRIHKIHTIRNLSEFHVFFLHSNSALDFTLPFLEINHIELKILLIGRVGDKIHRKYDTELDRSETKMNAIQSKWDKKPLSP